MFSRGPLECSGAFFKSFFFAEIHAFCQPPMTSLLRAPLAVGLEEILCTGRMTPRRTFIALCGAGLAPAQSTTVDLQTVRGAPWRADPSDSGLKLERSWQGNLCASKLINTDSRKIRVKQVVLFTVPLNLPPETRLYAESF